MTELTATSRRAGGDRRCVFVVTALGAFMASLDLSIVNVAFPALERTFDRRARGLAGLGHHRLQHRLRLRCSSSPGAPRTAWAAGGSSSPGSRSSAPGRRCAALAPSLGVLVAGRLVQGVGAAALLPSSLALLARGLPRDERSQVVALWGGIGALAVATGPSLGAVLITALRLARGVLRQPAGRRWSRGWSAVGPCRGCARPPPAPTPTTPGSCCWASPSPPWCWPSPRARAGAGAAPVWSAPSPSRWSCSAAFLARSARHPEPVLDLTLFRSRAFSVANAATLLYAMGFFAMLLGNILFLTSVWRYSILAAGLAVTPGPLVVALVAGRAGRAATRVGFRPVLLDRAGGLRRRARLVRDARGSGARLPRRLAARDAGRRPGHRPHLPGPLGRRGVEPAGGAASPWAARSTRRRARSAAPWGWRSWSSWSAGPGASPRRWRTSTICGGTAR